MFTLLTPSLPANSTGILSWGRSSNFGASGSVFFGSITTTWSLTISSWFFTSIEEPSANVTFSVPSDFPASFEFLAGFAVSVTSAASISAHTAAELLLSAGTTPFFQSILSPFQTLIVLGLIPPSSFSWSAIVAFLDTLITALTLSVVPSEYFTTTGILTAFSASPSTGV